MYTQANPIAARASLRLVKQTFVTHNKSQGPLLKLPLVEIKVLISFVPKIKSKCSQPKLGYNSLTDEVVT